MSTTFSGGRIRKAEFWEFYNIIKEKTLLEHPALHVRVKDIDQIDKIAKNKDLSISLQLFDIHPYYYFRVLSTGYWLENHFSVWRGSLPESFKRIGVHTGGGSRAENNKANGIRGLCQIIEDRIDPLIMEGHYFIVYVLDEDMIWKHLWENKKSI